MKKYCQLLGVFCFCFLAATSGAFAGEVGLEKLTLELCDTEDDGLRKVIRAGTFWENDLFKIKNNFNFNKSLDVDDYHSIDLKLGLPRFSGLNFDCDYKQNSNYDLASYGLNYDFKIGSNLRIGTELAAGEKNARTASRHRYRNNWEKYALQANYKYNLWDYDIKFIQNDKEYPQAQYYTALKRELTQKVTREIGQNSELGLQNKETIADYPYDTGLTKDYCKDEYQIWVKWRTAPETTWKLTCGSSVWDKGVAAFFGHYQENKTFIIDYRRKGEKWSGNGRLKWTDYFYSTERTVFDPDDDDDEYEDYKSRKEQNLVLGLERAWGKSKLGADFFVTLKDYRSGEHQKRHGVILNYDYRWEQNALRISLAPQGRASSSKKYYQIRWEYKPNRKSVKKAYKSGNLSQEDI